MGNARMATAEDASGVGRVPTTGYEMETDFITAER